MVYHLPSAIFWPKGHSNPQGQRGNIFPSTHLGIPPLDVHHAGKLSGDVLRPGLDTRWLAISELPDDMLLGLSDLLPSVRDGADLGCGRSKGVSESYVFSVGEQLLRRLGVPFMELIDRQLPSLEYLVEII
jgi:hypothetical protein